MITPPPYQKHWSSTIISNAWIVPKNISGLQHFLYYYLLDEMIKVFCMMCVLFLFWFFFRIVKRSRRMNVENLLLFTFAWDNILSRKHIFFLSKYLRTLDGNFTSVAHLKIKKKTSQKLFYCWNYFIHGPRVYVGKVCYAPYNYWWGKWWNSISRKIFASARPLTLPPLLHYYISTTRCMPVDEEKERWRCKQTTQLAN